MDYEQSQCFAWWAARAIRSKRTDYRRGGGNNEGHIATFLIHVKKKKKKKDTQKLTRKGQDSKNKRSDGVQ